jgi:3-phosphoshikimate 1-carboxyvinyltransferase
MTHLNITGGHRLTGRCQVPGDKSISHRAVMFSAIANGTSTVRNFLDGGDCHATIEVMRGLGVKVEERSPTELVIRLAWMGCKSHPTFSMSAIQVQPFA